MFPLLKFVGLKCSAKNSENCETEKFWILLKHEG